MPCSEVEQPQEPEQMSVTEAGPVAVAVAVLETDPVVEAAPGVEVGAVSAGTLDAGQPCVMMH